MVGLRQRLKLQHPHHMKVSPWRHIQEEKSTFFLALHEKYKVKRAKMLSTHTLKMREDKIHDLCC